MWTVISVGVFFALLLLLLLAEAAYDIWIYKVKGVQSTISRGIQWLGFNRPFFAMTFGLIIGYVIGALCGHFFWPQPALLP